MTCAIEGCGKPGYCKGWCKSHYTRWWRHGDPLGGGVTPGTPLVDRFMQKFKLENCGYPTLCWIWTDYLNQAGYGQFAIAAYHGGTTLAGRWIFTHLYGPVPKGLQVDHLCRIRACVNPDHLELVTNRENSIRGTYARITHCPQGHPYDVENTSYDNNHRRCKTCNRERAQRHRDAQRISR